MTNDPEGLGEAFIAKQRDRLLAMQRQVLGGEQNTLADERAIQQERGSEANEFEDDAQRMEQDIANQALRDVNDQRIGDIQRALEKIADGTYGQSDESGAPIPKARLEAMPEAIYTVEEQEKREQKR